MRLNPIAQSIAVLSISAALAACGGGGGGDVGQGATPTLPGTPPPATSTPLVTSVPTPIYAAGTEELAAFNTLNSQREQCGFGLVAQNSQLDQAARGHANWILTNGVASHDQDFGSRAYTGANSDARIAATGYEVTGQFRSWDNYFVLLGTTDKTNVGKTAVGVFLIAPYHAADLLSGYRDIGIGVMNSTEVDSPLFSRGVAVQLNAAYKLASGLQEPSTGGVKTFPCEGSTDVAYMLDNENPNPVPGRDLLRNPLGTTISISGNEGSNLLISSASMINTATGTPVTLRAPVGIDNDPNSRMASNQAFVSADSPMSPNTTYQASITGTINGTAFSRNFTFTTASGS